jgi:hypothetical protein
MSFVFLSLTTLLHDCIIHFVINYNLTQYLAAFSKTFTLCKQNLMKTFSVISSFFCLNSIFEQKVLFAEECIYADSFNALKGILQLGLDVPFFLIVIIVLNNYFYCEMPSCFDFMIVLHTYLVSPI